MLTGLPLTRAVLEERKQVLAHTEGVQGIIYCNPSGQKQQILPWSQRIQLRRNADEI